MKRYVGFTKTSLQNPAKKGPRSNKVIKRTFLPRLSGKGFRRTSEVK